MLFNTKFDLIISLGEDCACTSYLRRFNLQEYSYPFDWLTNASFITRINLICNHFDKFLSLEDLVAMDLFNPTEHDSYEDLTYKFYYYHDFLKNKELKETYPIVKAKYDRRIERMYQQIDKSENILFVWWSRDKHQSIDLIKKSYYELQNKFSNKNIYLLIIEYSEIKNDLFMENNHIFITQFDNISYKHNKKYNEVMGNEGNNNLIFKQIEMNRKINYYLHYAFYKFVRFFIGFIPFKNIRRNLRKTWDYNFNKGKL